MKDKIIKKAEQLGFGQISFIPAQPLPVWNDRIKELIAIDESLIDYWKSKGIISNYKAVMEDAKTIIVAIFPYLPCNFHFPQGQGYYSAHYLAYPKGRKAIAELGNLLIEAGFKAVIDPPIPAKQIAFLGGLGSYGKNSLIYNKQYGSFITLHIILTNAEIDYDETYTGQITDCGNCRLCINACPMQAITDKGLVLANKCLRFYMLSSETIPANIREKIGNRIVGCDDCQIVCPRNQNVMNKNEYCNKTDYIFDIRKVLIKAKTGLKEDMENIGKYIGKNYARTSKILSMIIIAAGNSEDDSYVPLLAETLSYNYPPIRAYSAWAIGKLGGYKAKELLLKALKQEKNKKVRQEIILALERMA